MSGFGVDRSSVASGSGASASSIPEAIIDAKGDLIAGSAADTPVRVAVGTDEKRLVADSTQAGGLGYVADTTNYAVAAKGDLLVGTAADTVAPLTVGAAGELPFPVSGATTGLAWLRMPSAGAFLINGKISRSAAGNALTIAVKTLADADPSTSSPVYVLMPTVTSNVFDGGYIIRSITAALSMTVSSGSTLGHTSAVASPVYLYLLDNAGTLELAVSNKFFGGASVQTTTAEGGAGAADSGTVLYSTTLRSNVAVVCLQRWKSTQTTAGTWAATTGEVQLYPFPHKASTVQVFTATGANTYTKPWDVLWVKVTVVGGGGSGGGGDLDGGFRGTGGGGGGASIKTIAAASLGATETATVGAGGAAVATQNVPTAGNAGGTTSFGAHLSATGGSGGAAGVTGDTVGGAAGTGADGDINVPGEIAHTKFGGESFPGRGANSAFGFGQPGNNVGSNAAGYGAGGAAGNHAGGNSGTGAPGVIFVEEHYV